MEGELRILMLEDSREDILLIQRELKRAGVVAQFLVVESKLPFERGLEEFIPDLILCDHSLPMFNSFEAIAILKSYEGKINRRVPVILVTGTISEEFASLCIQAGADDYVLKDRMKRLPDAIRSALKRCKVENERQAYFENVLAGEARVKEAEQLAKFGTWKVFLETGETKWSDGSYRLRGYEPGEIKLNYETFLEHVHPDDVDRVKREVEVAARSGSTIESEYRIITKEKKFKHINSRITIQAGENAKAVLVGFSVDITDRKLAEVRLQEAYKLARIGAWEVDLITGKPSWTDMTRQIHEQDEGFVPDLTSAINSYKEGGSRLAIESGIALGIANGTPWDLELQIVTAKGNERWVRAIGKAELRDGICVRLYGSLQDIDERKQAQIDLETQNKKLREIAWIQSHQVRAPLARMMGLLSLIINYKGPLMTQDEAIVKLSESASELDAIITKIVRTSEEIDSDVVYDKSADGF